MAIPVFMAAIIADKFTVFTGIEHEGEVWAVVEWTGNPTLGLRKPVLAIPLRLAAHKHLPDHPSFRYFLSDPLPGSLFDGTASPEERRRYGVQRAPDVSLPMAPKAHQ